MKKVRISRKSLRDLVLIALLTLLLAEIACRLVMPQPGFYPFAVDHVAGLKIPHPTRGFAYAPGFSGQRVTEDFTHSIRINALGLRDRDLDAEDLDRPTILALGNSFTAGIGVELEDTWPAQLERLLADSDETAGGWRVINAGVSAYSPRQIRQLGEELIPIIQPDVLVFSFLVDDYERIQNPYVFFNGTSVRSNMLPKLLPLQNGFLYSPFWSASLIRLDFFLDHYFWLGGHLIKAAQRLVNPPVPPHATTTMSTAEAHAALAPVLQELLTIQRIAAGKRIPVFVLLCNRQRVDGKFSAHARILNAVLRRTLESNGMSIVDPLEDLEATHRPGFEVRFASDAHWTPLGNRIVAESMNKAVTTLTETSSLSRPS